MIDVDTSPLWSLVGGLYLATAIYYETRYGDDITNWATGAFYAFGIGILLAVNRRAYITTDFWLGVAEVVVLVAITLGWLFGTMAVRKYIQFNRSLKKYRRAGEGDGP